MPIDYTNWYQSAREELEKLQRERAELIRGLAECDRQIAALIQTLNAMAPLAGEKPSDAPSNPGGEFTPPGLTDSIRSILAGASEPLTAAGIRDHLATLGFAASDYSNLLATIHTILRRLMDAREVQAHEADGGRTFSMAERKGYVVGLVMGRASKEGLHTEAELVAGKKLGGKNWKGVVGVARFTRKKKVS